MNNEVGLTLTGIRVLVRLPEIEEKTKGGIVLPRATQDKEEKAQTESILVDAGPDAWECAEMKGLERGDRVFFARYAGAGCEFSAEGKRYRVMNATDIIGKLARSLDSQFKAALPPAVNRL